MSRLSLPLIATLLTGAACSRHEPAEQGRTSPEGRPAPAASAPEYRLRGWQQGQAYDYRVRTSSLITLGGKAPLYDFDLKAAAHVVALEVTGDRGSFYLGLDNVEFISRIPGSQADFDALKGQLAQPYFFRLKGGLVTSAQLPKDLHPLATAVFRSISASLQFAALDGQPRAFSVNELDTTGEYVAEYSPGSAPSVWSKRKQRYLGILLGETESKEAREVAPKIVASEGNIQLSPDGRPVRIELRDELELASAQAPLHSKTTISLVAGSAQASNKPIAELLARRDQLITVAANAPFASASDLKSLDDAKIDGATFEQVLSKLEEMERKPAHEQAGAELEARRAELKRQAEGQSKLFVAMAALFRSQPGTLQKAVSKVKAKSAASDVLIDALGSAGSAEAQKVLSAFVLDPKADKLVRARAMLSLSRTENPTEDSMTTLLGLIRDEQLGTQALYGIGNYTRAFAQAGNLTRAKNLGGVLLQRLAAAKSDKALVEALRAIANSGFSPALPKVKGYLNDEREQVRVDAALALALINESEVDDILVDRLSADTAKKVRLAAIEAMGNRVPTDVLVRGLRRNITTDDPHVRYRALELMIRWLPKRGELRETVQQLAQNDSEQQIRELAKAAL